MSPERRANLPLPILLAPWSPTVILLAAAIARQAGAPLPEVAPITVALLWLCTTLPLVLLVVGLDQHARRSMQPADERHLQEAVAALRQAEAVSRQAAAALAQAQQAYAAHPGVATAGGPAPARAARWRQAAAVAALAILLVAGGGALAITLSRDPAETFIHEHATFALFLDGERIRFTDGAYDLGARGFMQGHLHTPDDATIHVEGAPGLTLGAFFERTLDARLGPDGVLVLGADVHANRTAADLRLFVAPAGGDWAAVRDLDAATYQPRDGDRILLTTSTDADEVGRQMMEVPTRTAT